MITYNKICEACMGLDNLAGKIGLEKIAELAGVDPKAMMKAADQRAIRVYYLLHRKQPLPPPYTPVNIPEGGKKIFGEFMAAWVDGFMTGFALGEKQAMEGKR